MTSKQFHAKVAYVWMWLPKALQPVVIGKMVLEAGRYHFAYGKNYRARSDAIALSPVELPLSAKTFSPIGLHEMPACWDGQSLSFTPAYDLAPQLRTGYEATQAMKINGVQGNLSTLVNVLSIHETFLLEEQEAKSIINRQIDILDTYWLDLCKKAKLSAPERARLWGSVVKSNYCLQGWLV